MTEQEFDPREGTISSWLTFDSLDDEGVIFDAKHDEGSIKLSQKDRKLVFTHKLEGELTETSYNIASLNMDEKHQVVVTWSKESEEIEIFVDGEKRNDQDMKT